MLAWALVVAKIAVVAVLIACTASLVAALRRGRRR
jgi:hypothetical protein